MYANKKLLQWSLNIMLVFFVSTLVVVLAGLWLGKNDPRHVPGLGPYKLITVLSDSMQPVMRAGDAVVIDAGAGAIEKGDIITFWRNDYSLLTHRVIDMEYRGEQEQFYTRGDANNVVDGNPVTRRDIVGKYLFCVPYGGFVISYLHTGAGFLSFVVFPVALALLFGIRKVLIDINTLRNNEDTDSPNQTPDRRALT